MTEKQLQALICDWMRFSQPNIIFRSDAAGLRLSRGMRQDLHRINNPKSGFPDLMILEPIGKYHALAIELKKDRAVVYKKDGSYKKDPHLEKQLKILRILRKKGFCVGLCCGFDETVNYIDLYLAGEL